MNRHHLIVIGASAGGFSALTRLISYIPDSINAAILIVLHLNPTYKSNLPTIIQKHTKIPVMHHAEIQEVIPGAIYIAPPNCHMTLLDGKILLRNGPKINYNRPAIDPLFYSAALYYGPLAIGIVLSGVLDDGAAGLLAIKKCRGTAITQAIEEAEFPDMPLNAAKATKVDFSLPIKEIAELLPTLIQQNAARKASKKEEFWDILAIESQMNYTEGLISSDLISTIGTPSKFSCPDCHGVLWHINDSSYKRYRCRVGHAYGEIGLKAGLDIEIEDYLWNAYRSLEEKESLLNNMNNSEATELKKVHKQILLLKKFLKSKL